MKKRSNRLWDCCTRTLGLETKLEKRWFIAAFILLFAYLWAMQFLRSYLMLEYTPEPGCLMVYSAFLALPLCVFGLMLLTNVQITAVPPEVQAGAFRRFFPLIASTLTFGYLLVWLTAFLPGGFPPDCVDQYKQVLTGSYNNWHPILQTWLFFWIPWQIFHHPAGFAFFQIILFSLSVAYLYRVLCRRGCPAWFLIISWLFLATNPQTAKTMMFPWKDSALTIAALMIFTQLIEIFETEGTWLCKWHHFLSFTGMCFLATSFRHNAILLTAPVYILLFLFQKKHRKTVALSALLMLLAMWLLNGPVMQLFHVTSPGNRQEELLGLPMTVLSAVYVHQRDALSPDAISFLDSIASSEDWRLCFELGNFNRLKFSSSLPLVSRIEAEGAANVLRYTVQAFLSSPFWSLRAVISLTKLVWDPLSGTGTIDTPYCTPNDISLTGQGYGPLKSALTSWCETADSSFLFPFTNCVGMMILILMFAAVTHIGRGKLGRAFMIFPMLIYDFGTMLLLTGPDFRFFHFNFVIIIPLLYLILCEKAEAAEAVPKEESHENQG